MNHTLRFTLNYLLHPLRNASLIPSSSFAAAAMLESIDFSALQTVVELGPGIGVFTEELVKRCRLDAKIILFEIEPAYVKLLKERFGERVIVERQSAALFREVTARYTEKPIDLIISGLPFSLPKDTKAKLFESLRVCTARGTIYRFFTYNPPVMKRVYRGLPIRKISFVLRNFPPLWVYGIH